MDNKDNELQMIDDEKNDPDFEVVKTTNSDKVDNIISEDGSIITSDYDELPPLENDEQAEVLSEKEDCIHIDYSFKGEDVVEGLSTMQAILRFKKNMINTIILSVVFLVYMLDFTNIQSIILGCLCLVVIGVIWIMPKIHIKRFAKAADENNIKLSMDIYANSIKVVNSQNVAANLSFNGQINNIIETENLFVICSGKERVFIVPKRCINENLHEFIKEIFEIAMGDKFHQKNIVI